MPACELECEMRDCACFWRRHCSPRIPRVGPGRDYICIPAGADHSPAWSLLVGVTEGGVLRLKRLRVVRSVRILGRSDHALEAFHDLAKPPTGRELSAGAALAPDGRSLCVLRQAAGEKPQVLQLSLLQLYTDEDLLPAIKELPLPPEVEGSSRCLPISAAGNIWDVSVRSEPHMKFSIVMRRLVGGCRWEQQVSDALTSPYIHGVDRRWDGEFLQCYAVLPALILVSFKQAGLFFAFAPDSGNWTPVLTDATKLRDYVPILGRGVYVEQDEAVYMLRDNIIYAYKLTYHHHQDDDRRQLKLDPPITIDSVCPFNSCRGYGLLTHLHGRLMCSVWISLAWRQPCLCDYLHAIVTTFHLRDPALGGIEVLHSTYRRVDMEPDPPHQHFCVVQEYEDAGSPALLQEDSQHVDQPLKMLDCCRGYLIPTSMQHKVRLSSRPVVP